MNPLHHPDQPRCKKLTEIGFPETETNWGEEGDHYVCPSVMEMLNVIPNDIVSKELGFIDRVCSVRFNKYYAWYLCPEPHPYVARVSVHCDKGLTLADNLCDLIIWLVKNKYITF